MTKDLTARQEGKLYDREGKLWGKVSGIAAYAVTEINIADIHRLIDAGTAEITYLDGDVCELRLQFGAVDLLKAWDSHERMYQKWANELSLNFDIVRQLSELRDDVKGMEALLHTYRCRIKRLQDQLASKCEE